MLANFRLFNMLLVFWAVVFPLIPPRVVPQRELNSVNRGTDIVLSQILDRQVNQVHCAQDIVIRSCYSAVVSDPNRSFLMRPISAAVQKLYSYILFTEWAEILKWTTQYNSPSVLDRIKHPAVIERYHRLNKLKFVGLIHPPIIASMMSSPPFALATSRTLALSNAANLDHLVTIELVNKWAISETYPREVPWRETTA